MSTRTIEPDATVDQATWVRTGGATVHGVLSDDSDATYMTPPNDTTSVLEVGMANPGAAPVQNRIVGVTPKLRVERPGAAGSFGIRLRSGAQDTSEATTGILPTGPATISVTPPFTHAPDGGEWNETKLFGLSFKARVGAGGDTLRLIDVDLDIEDNEAPVVTVTQPADDDTTAAGTTVTSTSTPSTAWTYTDPENDPQERWRVRRYLQPTAGWAGFDPDNTSEVPVEERTGVGTATSTAMSTALTNGATYRDYVIAADTTPSGFAVRYSSWAYREFTVSLLPPQAPLLVSVTPDTPNAEVDILLQGRDNLLSANQASIETDTTGWAVATGGNCTLSRTTAQFVKGAASLALTATATDAMAATTPDGVNGFPVTAGKQYTLILSSRAATTPNTIFAGIRFFDAAGVYLANIDVTPAANSTTAWTTYTATGTAPANAAFAALAVGTFGTTAGETQYFDALSIAPGALTTWTPGGMVPYRTWEVQRSEDGGATWVDVPPEPTTTATVQEFGVTDWLAPRETVLTYRARGVVEETAGLVLVSEWSNTLSATLASDGSAWLKSTTDPALNMKIDVTPDGSGPSTIGSESEEPQSVYYAQGRFYPTVHSADIRAERFPTLGLQFDNDAEREAFEALRALQEPLLLQLCNGDDGLEQHYVRLGGVRVWRRVTDTMQNTAQEALYSVVATEVEMP